MSAAEPAPRKRSRGRALVLLPAALFAGLAAAFYWGLMNSDDRLPSALIGRALFYVLVIPTTMPGAFFWKNTAFEEHARKTGLADLPQVGVVPENRL